MGQSHNHKVLQEKMKTINEILTTATPLDDVSGKQLWSLLPVLEHPWSEEVTRQILAAGFQPEKILALALSEHSDFWRGLSIQWINAGCPISETLADTLLKLGKSKIGTQKDRHSAFRFATQWKKMQNQVLNRTVDPAGSTSG